MIKQIKNVVGFSGRIATNAMTIIAATPFSGVKYGLIAAGITATRVADSLDSIGENMLFEVDRIEQYENKIIEAGAKATARIKGWQLTPGSEASTLVSSANAIDTEDADMNAPGTARCNYCATELKAANLSAHEEACQGRYEAARARTRELLDEDEGLPISKAVGKACADTVANRSFRSGIKERLMLENPWAPTGAEATA